MAKPDITKVVPEWARRAMARALSRGGNHIINSIYSEYVQISFRTTGKLNSGCDAKDLTEWYKKVMPEEFKKAGGK